MRKFSTLKRSPTGRTRMVTALSGVGALVMSGGLVMLGTSSATATAETPAPEKKVVVCKYVNTPEEAEYLHHVIIVSSSTLKKAVPGWDGLTFSPPVAFVDAHGGSKAIRFAADGEHASTISLGECPGYEPPGPESVPFDTPDVNDPCGTADDEVVLPKSPDSHGVTYVLTRDQLSWSVVITAPAGKTLAGTGGKPSVTQSGRFTDVPCAEDDKRIVVCKYVGSPPGVADHIIITSVSALGKHWDGKFPAAFPDAQDSVAVRYAADNEQAQDVPLSVCPELRTQKTPVGVDITDPCGPDNVAWVAKSDEFFTYSETNGVVTATQKSPGAYVGTGQTSWRLSDYERNIPCSTVITIDPPSAPPTIDPCGPANIRYDVPADSGALNYELLPNGSVTASPQAGYVFSGPTQLVTFLLPADSGVPCPLGVEEIAPEVTFTDPDCDNLQGAEWSGTLKEIVDYSVEGTPGLGESVTVTVTVQPALAGRFAFPDGYDTTTDHRYPTLAQLECVFGEETVVPGPKPEKPPVVLGTQAAVPTQVHAGMSTLPTTGSPTNVLLAQLLVAGGLLLLVAGGWLGLREPGAEGGRHQA